MKTILQIAAGWFIGNYLFQLLFPPSEKSQTGGSGTGASAGSGAAGSGANAQSYVSGGNAPDYSALAAAIQALAAGVQLPNIVTVETTVPNGTTEIVAGTGGKRICVLAFSATSAGATVVRFLSQGSGLWRIGLDAPAGKSGANLSTAWPSYLFATPGGGNLQVETQQSTEISVTYWMESV
jgi:hypothetical protein